MNSNDSTKLALEHSREVFIYHAGQRIQSLNFYFVAIAVFLTGFGLVAASALKAADRALVGIVLAFAGFYLTKLFQMLDKRNEYIVLCDEKLLKYAEKTWQMCLSLRYLLGKLRIVQKHRTKANTTAQLCRKYLAFTNF